MSRKPENVFINKVHKKLPSEVYGEKTNNPYRAGIPDCVYEGVQYHWAEYKWLPRTPVRSFTPEVTTLQYDWLKRAYDKGHDPWVIVGFPDGCYILQNPKHWQGQVHTYGLQHYSIDQLVELIVQKVS